MDVEPSSLNFVGLWSPQPVEPCRSSGRSSGHLAGGIEVLAYSSPKAYGKSDVKDGSVKCCQNIASAIRRQKALAAPPKAFSVLRHWDQLRDVRISMAVAIDALCSARVIS